MSEKRLEMKFANSGKKVIGRDREFKFPTSNCDFEPYSKKRKRAMERKVSLAIAGQTCLALNTRSNSLDFLSFSGKGSGMKYNR